MAYGGPLPYGLAGPAAAPSAGGGGAGPSGAPAQPPLERRHPIPVLHPVYCTPPAQGGAGGAPAPPGSGGYYVGPPSPYPVMYGMYASPPAYDPRLVQNYLPPMYTPYYGMPPSAGPNPWAAHAGAGGGGARGAPACRGGRGEGALGVGAAEPAAHFPAALLPLPDQPGRQPGPPRRDGRLVRGHLPAPGRGATPPPALRAPDPRRPGRPPGRGWGGPGAGRPRSRGRHGRGCLLCIAHPHLEHRGPPRGTASAAPARGARAPRLNYIALQPGV